MSIISIFDNLKFKLSGNLSKAIEVFISNYISTWVLLQFPIWMVIGIWYCFHLNLASLTSGFQLFEYFPYWIRIILLFFIFDAIISLPITLFVEGILEVVDAGKIAESKIETRNKMRINCVVCNNEIKPPGEWLSGEADLCCPECYALMTLVLEDGKFKKLTLKKMLWQ